MVLPNWFVASRAYVVVPTGGIIMRVLPRTAPTCGVMMLYSPPLTAQVKLGCGASNVPNWSFAVAAYCCVPPAGTAALAGETAMLVNVWLTVTLTVLVVLRPLTSVMVTRNWYVPVAVNVTVVLLAVLLPLTENVGCAPVGPLASAQV